MSNFIFVVLVIFSALSILYIIDLFDPKPKKAIMIRPPKVFVEDKLPAVWRKNNF